MTKSATTAATTAEQGKHCWRVVYSGDGTYLPASHTNSGSECFTTTKQLSFPDTRADPRLEVTPTVDPGTSVKDEVFVESLPGQPTPTGFVSFFLCKPSELEPLGMPGESCRTKGTLVSTNTLVGGTVFSDATTAT